MQHIQYIHPDHFEKRYFRQAPQKSLERFIEFFWESRFDSLLEMQPAGFTDILFPNIGYTYLINLGTPFEIDFANNAIQLKNNGLLPRHQSLAAHHVTGNHIFGIKFRVSPVLFEKKVDFSEYKNSISSLSYLIDKQVLDSLKMQQDFSQRVAVVSDYYQSVIDKYAGSMQLVDVVTGILKEYKPSPEKTVEELAEEFGLTPRTLLRYFNSSTGMSPKHAFKIMRIRKAIKAQVAAPSHFDPTLFGYYDLSHYYRQLKLFFMHNGQSYFPAYLQSLK